MSSPTSYQLGDLLAVGDNPAKMLKALAAVASRLHPSYDEITAEFVTKMGSRDKCLFASLAVRDFLVGIGYRDATVRACGFYIDALDLDGKKIWSLGLGAPGEPDEPDKFNGHAVVVVPSLDLLIDVTLYQAIREHWNGTLTGMMALPYHEPYTDQLFMDRPVIAGFEAVHEDRRVRVAWVDRPEINWKRDIDFRNKNDRRRMVTRELIRTFGKWND